MKGSGMTGRIPSKFKSIQSAIFAVVTVLLVLPLLVVAAVMECYVTPQVMQLFM